MWEFWKRVSSLLLEKMTGYKELIMNNISAQEQRKRFRRFSKSHFTYTGRIPLALPVILAFLSIVFCSIPATEDVVGWYVSFCLAGVIPGVLLSPYLRAMNENQPEQKQQRICQVMRYLPISGKQIRRELEANLWGFLWKFSLIAVLCRTLTSYLAGAFQISHILFVLVMTLVLPMALGSLNLWLHFGKTEGFFG